MVQCGFHRMFGATDFFRRTSFLKFYIGISLHLFWLYGVIQAAPFLILQ
jgi:hypothetical protein